MYNADSLTTTLADNLVYKFEPVADNVWREASVPLTDFFTSTFGTGAFDLTQVGKFGFGVSRSVDGMVSEGSVYFDDFRMAQISSPVSVIDSAEGINSAVNDRAGPQPVYTGTGGAGTPSMSFVTVSTISHGGTKSREYHCNVDSGFCFVSEILGGLSARGDESIEFWVRGVVGNEPLKVELKSRSPSVTVSQSISSIAAGSFTKKALSLASFKAINSSLNLSALTEIVFVFDDIGGNHKIYFDDLSLVGPSKPTVLLQTLDTFPRQFQSYYEASAPTETATVGLLGKWTLSVPGHSGVSNPVARLNFSFSGTFGMAFAVAEKRLGANFLLEPSVQFLYKGTGANSDIEVKLKDSDGTVYRKVLSDASDTGGVWKNVKIPVDQFSFVSLGDDANLSLARIPQMEFILSRGAPRRGPSPWTPSRVYPLPTWKKVLWVTFSRA